jgi:hypothetical protein
MKQKEKATRFDSLGGVVSFSAALVAKRPSLGSSSHTFAVKQPKKGAISCVTVHFLRLLGAETSRL